MMLFLLAAAAALFCCVALLRWFCAPVFSARQHRRAAASLAPPVFLQPDGGAAVPFPTLAAPPSVYLSLIVPSYNEEERLPIMLDQTMAYLLCASLSAGGSGGGLVVTVALRQTHLICPACV